MLINDQRAEAVRNIPYGVSTVGKSGCAAVAAYNALTLLGRPADFEAVIKCFEAGFSRGGGLFARGRLGALPHNIANVLKRFGLRPRGGLMRRLRRIKDKGVFILTYWNKPLKYGAHTVAVRFDGETYTAYNAARRPVTKDGLSAFLPGRHRLIYGYFVPDGLRGAEK